MCSLLQADYTKEKGSQAYDKAKEKGSEAEDNLKTKASQATDKVADKTSELAEKARDKAQVCDGCAVDCFDRTRIICFCTIKNPRHLFKKPLWNDMVS